MAVSIEKAIEIISNLNIIPSFEILPIENAILRICAENIKAKISLPKFNNSAMDGYSIIYEDKDNELEIIETIFAGDNNNKLLEKNSCIKIMTGAKIPDNSTAIIPKEDIELIDNNKLRTINNVKEFQHIRYIGEDIKENDLLLEIGDEINFSKIALLSSQGITHIKVYKKPKVIVFSSGEELKPHYEKTENYQIYNSNTPSLIARCKELNCDVNFIGQAKDSIEDIKKLISNSLDADLIITSGGVSVGDADFTKDAFNEFKFIPLFEGINIKPGKPTIFGQINNTYILNLPGNPLASSLIFELFGKLIILKILGAKELYHNFILGKNYIEHKIKKGKFSILPGFFDGEYFSISEKNSPGMVSTLSKSNSIIIIDDKIEHLEKNKILKILPINWKFFSTDKKDFIIHE